MKLKKILAAVSATAVAVATMAVSASAAITGAEVGTVDGDGNYTYDFGQVLKDEGLVEYFDPADVASIKITLGGEFAASDSDAEDIILSNDGVGGGFIINSTTAGWGSKEWGNKSGNKAIVLGMDADGNGVIERTIAEGEITAADFEEEGYFQVCLQQWWGGDFSVKNVEILDAEGNDLLLAAGAAAKAAREQAAADALAALMNAMNEIENPFDTADSVAAAAEALADAKAALAAVEDKLAELDTLADKVAAAEEAFAALQDNDTADRDALAETKANIDNAKAALAEAKEALMTAMEEYDAATAEKIAEKDETIAGLEDEKAALEAELAALKAQAEADAAKIAELESAIAEKDAAIAALEDEKAALAADLEEALKNAGNGDDKPADDKPADDKPADDNPATGVAVAFGGLALAAVAAVAAVTTTGLP